MSIDQSLRAVVEDAVSHRDQRLLNELDKRYARPEKAASPDGDRWLSAKNVADYLDASVPTVRRYIRSGKLRSASVEGIVRVKRSWCDELLLNNKSNN